MTLAVMGTTSSTTTSITLPTHAIGDLIIIMAYRGAASQATIPTAGGTVPAWVSLDVTPGSTASSEDVYFVATATNHTSGTWANANGMCAVVIRGQNATAPIGAHAQSAALLSGGSTAPSITQTLTNGSAMLLHLLSHANLTAWAAAPAGYTSQLAAVGSASLPGFSVLTKNSTTSDGSVTQSCTSAASSYACHTIEILPATSASNNFLAMF